MASRAQARAQAALKAKNAARKTAKKATATKAKPKVAPKKKTKVLQKARFARPGAKVKILSKEHGKRVAKANRAGAKVPLS